MIIVDQIVNGRVDWSLVEMLESINICQCPKPLYETVIHDCPEWRVVVYRASNFRNDTWFGEPKIAAVKLYRKYRRPDPEVQIWQDEFGKVQVMPYDLRSIVFRAQ